MINGNRLKQARELRGKTQTELAKEISVSQAFIAQIEAGLVQPTEEHLKAISSALELPTAFFRQDAPLDFPLGTLLYRSRASIKTSDKAKAYRYAQLEFEMYEKLALWFDEVPLRIPKVSGTLIEPVDPGYAAMLTRTTMGLSPDAPIDNLINSVEKAGIIFLALPTQYPGIDAFSLWAGTKEQRPVIVLSGGAPADRLRFTIAHELGHLVMHQPPNGTISEIEKEADTFASEFLLPETTLREELTLPVTLTNLANLKLRWKVSIQALIRRAYDLSIISERQYRYLFEQLSSYGWRTSEPKNLEPPEEKPRLIRQMVELHYHRPIDYQRFANDMFLQVSEGEAILEAFAGKRPQIQAESDALPNNIVPFATRRKVE